MREHAPYLTHTAPVGLQWAILQLAAPGGLSSKDEAARIWNEVSTPTVIAYYGATSGTYSVEIGHLGPRTAAYFGVPDPPGANPGNGIVGHFDDPHWLPRDRAELLRRRILAALDVLLPFFADEARPWTDEANRAAREVRDFFPLAAEPGLWPYYKAEGKEFFAWVEKNAPPAKAPLPWGAP